MLGLTEKGGLSSGSSVTFDHLFTFFPLLDEFSKRGIKGLITIRQNRVENAAVPSKETMRKTEKGFCDCSTDNRGNAVVFWHGTAIATYIQVMVALHQRALLNGGRQKKKNNVLVAHALMLYIQKMGRVGLFDQFVATYRARVCSKN